MKYKAEGLLYENLLQQLLRDLMDWPRKRWGASV